MSLLSSTFLSCRAIPTAMPTGPSGMQTITATLTTTFTTTYCVTLPAACPTSEWIATYNVEEICTGNSATWTPPAVPRNFVVTTVTCDVCEHKTQEITCPNALATAGPRVVSGNGIVATMTVAETASPSSDRSGMSPGSGSFGSGSASGSDSGSGSGSDSDFGSGSGSGSGFATQSGTGLGGTTSMPQSDNPFASPTSSIVTAGVAQLQRGVLLVAGVAAALALIGMQ